MKKLPVWIKGFSSDGEKISISFGGGAPHQ